MCILTLIWSFDRGHRVFSGLPGYVTEGALLWAVSFVFGIVQGLRAQRLPVRAGIETMLGKSVRALTPIDAKGGKIFVEGEYWNATSDALIEKGRPVQIVAVESLTVRV